VAIRCCGPKGEIQTERLPWGHGFAPLCSSRNRSLEWGEAKGSDLRDTIFHRTESRSGLGPGSSVLDGPAHDNGCNRQTGDGGYSILVTDILAHG